MYKYLLILTLFFTGRTYGEFVDIFNETTPRMQGDAAQVGTVQSTKAEKVLELDRPTPKPYMAQFGYKLQETALMKGARVRVRFQMSCSEKTEVTCKVSAKTERGFRGAEAEIFEVSPEKTEHIYDAEWPLAEGGFSSTPVFTIQVGGAKGRYVLSAIALEVVGRAAEDAAVSRETECIPGLIPFADENIRVSGSRYHHDGASGREYLRFREDICGADPTALMFSPEKARTTTGVALQFKTSAEQMKLYFYTNQGDENRGAEFGVYSDGTFLTEFSFGKQDSAAMVLEINNAGDKAAFYEVTLPSWANARFRGMTLPAGAVLETLPPDNRKVYVVLGDSISHGTGQGSATWKTWPWLVSRLLDMKLYNLAVGGGKISVPVAEMLKDFERIDLVTVLIGYNDWNTGISGDEFYTNYRKLIAAIRANHPQTRIVCISPLYTKSEISKKSDLPISVFRDAVVKLVKDCQQSGDQNIRLIEGETITSEGNLRDVVHLNIEGAQLFAEQLAAILKTDL